MILKFHFKYLHLNSIRDFFHYCGEIEFGVMFKIFNNRDATGADQAELVPATSTACAPVGSSCGGSALDEVDFPCIWPAITLAHIMSFPYWFRMPSLS